MLAESIVHPHKTVSNSCTVTGFFSLEDLLKDLQALENLCLSREVFVCVGLSSPTVSSSRCQWKRGSAPRGADVHSEQPL